MTFVRKICTYNVDEIDKAMRKDFFYAFLSFAKHETDFLPYSNIDSKKYSGSVLAKISRNNPEVNAKLEVQNPCTKIIE